MKLEGVGADGTPFTIYAALQCRGKTIAEYIKEDESPQSSSTSAVFVPVEIGKEIQVGYKFEGTFSRLQVDMFLDGIYSHSKFAFTPKNGTDTTSRHHIFDCGLTPEGCTCKLVVCPRADEALKAV
jgi:hypothetical protein